MNLQLHGERDTGLLYPELQFQKGGAGKVMPIGLSVEVFGLAKTPQYNGCTGVIQSWDEKLGRCDLNFEWPDSHATPASDSSLRAAARNLTLALSESFPLRAPQCEFGLARVRCAHLQVRGLRAGFQQPAQHQQKAGSQA